MASKSGLLVLLLCVALVASSACTVALPALGGVIASSKKREKGETSLVLPTVLVLIPVGLLVDVAIIEHEMSNIH